MDSTPQEWQSWLEAGARDIVFRAVCNALRRGGIPASQAFTLADDATQEAIQWLLDSDPKPDIKTLPRFVSYLRTAAIRSVWSEHRRPVASAQADSIPARVPDSLPPSLEVSDALTAALQEDMTPEDREILSLKYDSGATDHEIADKIMPPDDRSPSARAQDLRRRRLEVLERLRLHLRRRGISDFPLDSGLDGLYALEG